MKKTFIYSYKIMIIHNIVFLEIKTFCEYIVLVLEREFLSFYMTIILFYLKFKHFHKNRLFKLYIVWCVVVYTTPNIIVPFLNDIKKIS